MAKTYSGYGPWVDFICDWIDTMTKEFGSVVYGHGRTWDWGQALCVEQYGLDDKAWPDSPSRDDVDKAIAWEEGEDWPKWVRREAP